MEAEVMLGRSLFKIERHGRNITAYKGDEPYYTIDVTLPEYPLTDAIWVKVGDKEELIANKIDWLGWTSQTVRGGYNTYRMYTLLNS